MLDTEETIDHATLSRLVEARIVCSADVIGYPNGWSVVIRYGMAERTLAARRGSARMFRKFETLVSFLKELGITQFHVNTADFDMQALKATRLRPDAAQRMRGAFAAKAQTDKLQEREAMAA
jgi:hypothetical protein